MKRYGSQKPLQRLFQSLALIFAIYAGPTWAAPLTFSDGVFNIADWSTAVLFQNGSVSFAVQQVLSGGNPNEYRRLQQSFGPGDIRTGHVRNGFVYDPSTQGAIAHLNFSLDLILFNGGLPQAVAYGALLVQNNTFYPYGLGVDGGFVLTTIAPVTNLWVSHSIPNLSATDFLRIAGSGPLHPDFSASGSPIQFGYYASNGNGQGFSTTDSGIDNWSVTITPELIDCEQDLAAAEEEILDLQDQLNTLTAQNAQLQQQLQNLENQLAQLTTALGSGLISVQTDFRVVFNNPTFMIPGATLLEQYQNLINAILNLNKGRKMGVYTNLGGVP